MIEIKGKYNTASIYTDSIEDEAYKQVLNLMNQKFAEGSKFAIMPDCHAGAGCVIGLTMKIVDKVVPNLVGVDIGCLDKDTEFLSPTGWKKISEYNNEQILLYEPETGKAYFGFPNAHIKNPCKTFYHFHNSKNLDQMVSDEHHLLVYKGSKARGFTRYDVTASDFVEKTKKMKKCDYYLAKSVFEIENTGLPYSDTQVRIFVMVSADGRIKPLINGETYTELHLMKERKIRRAQELLNSAKIEYTINTLKDGTTLIAFSDKVINTKDLAQFYRASKHQLSIICDEVMLWDGTIDEKRSHKHYTSTIKANADVIQYAFSAVGVRASICKYEAPNENWNCWYMVTPTKNEYVSYKNVDVVDSVDGYKYCFNTTTGAFVIRRNDKISVTGNCGMLVAKIDKSFVFDMQKVDRIWHEDIPSGMNHRPSKHRFADQAKIEDIIAPINIDKLKLSVGTLGGGNHFGEIDVDDEGDYYIVIHSGSRHLGIEVCKHYQNLAIKYHKDRKKSDISIIEQLKKEGRQFEIEAVLKAAKASAPSIPDELAYLEGQHLEDYLHDMKIAQEYAIWNREAMMEVILGGLGIGKDKILEKFCTIHNYIDVENRILRKGSISLQKDETAIIPINMRDGSLIVRGKGNPEWNFSGPHGAGRLMSRSKAKESLKMEDFKATMDGIYTTCVSSRTIDESPMAYKPMEEIIRNIDATAEIVKTIKPIYNFKAAE